MHMQASLPATVSYLACLSRIQESICDALLIYQKCFGTLVDWERDIICVGPRVGHVHNAEILKDFPQQMARLFLDTPWQFMAFTCWSITEFEILDLNTLWHFAMGENVWDEGYYIHGDAGTSLERCSPAGMVQQISALDTLTIVGRINVSSGDPFSALLKITIELLDNILLSRSL